MALKTPPALSSLRQSIGELFRSIRSPDPATRWAGWAFFAALSLAGVIGYKLIRPPTSVGGAGATVGVGHTPDDVADNFSEFIEKSQQNSQWKETILGLGAFTFDLKGDAEETKQPLGQLELFVQCDSKETCDYLHEVSVQARAEVTKALIDISRDDLYSNEGKSRLKKAILERLNSWLPHGKVETLFFSKLTIT